MQTSTPIQVPVSTVEKPSRSLSASVTPTVETTFNTARKCGLSLKVHGLLLVQVGDKIALHQGPPTIEFSSPDEVIQFLDDLDEAFSILIKDMLHENSEN